MFLHVDFLNEQGILGFTTTPDKIAANLALLPSFEEAVQQQRAKTAKAFALINPVGRWVIAYRENRKAPYEKRMYFIDFRYPVEPYIAGMLGSELAAAVVAQREKYNREYLEKNNTVELTPAEPYEKIMAPNVFACTVDERVILKAQTLGVLPSLEARTGEAGTKASFAEEVEGSGVASVRNLYALLRFHRTTNEGKLDEGYMYLKLRDLDKNVAQLDGFLDKVLSTGVSFDRGSMLKQFTRE